MHFIKVVFHRGKRYYFAADLIHKTKTDNTTIPSAVLTAVLTVLAD